MKYNHVLLTQRLALLVFSFIFIFNFQLKANSIFQQGNWYKFSINRPGVYKLDYNFMVNELKIKTDDLKTSNLGVFGYGGGPLPEYYVANVNQVKENNI